MYHEKKGENREELGGVARPLFLSICSLMILLRRAPSEYENILAPADTRLLSPVPVRLCFIWATSLTPFLREREEEAIRGIRLHPRGSEIRRAPQLIRHLIGDVWAQHRGVP